MPAQELVEPSRDTAQLNCLRSILTLLCNPSFGYRHWSRLLQRAT
jgi:hypothetical protein